MYRRIRKLPDEGELPGWYALLPPPPEARRLGSTIRADCAVVGAGYTGLAAVRQLAESRPEWHIVLLEGQRIGAGTSGRNSGLVVDFANNSAWADRDVRRKAARINRAGIAMLRERARHLGLGEHWSETGWLHTVASERTRPLLDRMRAVLDEAGEPYETFDAERLRETLGTAHYRAAVRLPGGALVQPAALARGLAGDLPASVESYEESPVVSIASGATVRLETAGGTVDADRAILAVNGLSPTLGVLRQRVFPLMTFAALTRILDPEERRILGGEPEWGLIALEGLGASLRRTRDHRLYVRSTLHYARDGRLTPSAFARAADAHRRALRERYPGLGDVELEYHWSGILGITRNRLPWFGRLGPNLWTAAGYSGAGISMATSVGRLLAQHVLGEGSDLLRDMLSLPRPGWVPPEPFFGPLARLHLRRLHRREIVKL